jgi:hypothetical protein
MYHFPALYLLKFDLYIFVKCVDNCRDIPHLEYTYDPNVYFFFCIHRSRSFILDTRVGEERSLGNRRCSWEDNLLKMILGTTFI